MTEHRGPIIDNDRSAHLCDVGGPGYLVCVTVDSDGVEAMWVVDLDQHDRPDGVCGNPNQEHERVGRLPGGWRERIWGELARCGRPTAAGQPCRRMVSALGEPCTQHRDKPAPATPLKPRQSWPRAVCPHCGVNVAVAPKRGTFTPHWHQHKGCHPANWQDLVKEWWEREGHWIPSLEEALEEYERFDGWPCPMSGEPANISMRRGGDD